MITKAILFGQLTDIEALWLTAYGESRGEPVEGQIAVMNVIKNRVKPGTNYVNVISKPQQFSCWNDDDPNLPILVELGEQNTFFAKSSSLIIDQIKFLANGIITNQLLDNTKGSTHYLVTALFNSTICPSWAKGRTPRVIIGNQTFLCVP